MKSTARRVGLIALGGSGFATGILCAACGAHSAEAPSPAFESRAHTEGVMVEESEAKRGRGLVLESPGFRHGETLARRFSMEGENVSPPLTWRGAPKGTQSFALIVTDPDAPGGTFTHWVLWDIPADSRALEPGDPEGIAGKNDFGQAGWGGPMPPPGHGPHRYVFRLYALDVPSLGLREGASRTEVEQRIRAHILGASELLGTYERRRAAGE